MPRWTIVLLIIVVAAVFRFQNITSAPPGLYPDEAMNGNNAIQALETGDYKVFYPENNGREGLFINLQALSLKVFGPSAHSTNPGQAGSGQDYPIWALRIVSAIIGVLTILGLYLLANKLFNWQIAALSSYLMAIGFWHVNFSRIGFRAIMAPFLLVWGIYFLWRGLSSGRLWNFAISAVFWGLGFYTYIAFRAIPLALIITLLAYWHSLKKDYGHEKYEHVRNQLLRGLALFLVIAVLVSLPIGYYFWTHPSDFFGRLGQVSVFASDNPLQSLAQNTVQTLGMFNFVGDYNWRHNVAGQPILLWPAGIFFAIGFFRSWIKLFKRAKTHGHLSSVQVLLLSWFFIGLIPVVTSNEGLPHALRVIIVAPVVFIWAGEGLWWIIDKIGDWYRSRDKHESRTFLGLYDAHKGFTNSEKVRDEFHIRQRWMKESSFVTVLALVVLLAALTVAEYDKYFNKWAKNPETAGAFNQNYVEIGERLNAMTTNASARGGSRPKADQPMAGAKTFGGKKYVLVNAGDVLVNGIPVSGQTVMFVTDTYTPKKQMAKRIFYLTQEQFDKGEYDRRGVVIPLEK